MARHNRDGRGWDQRGRDYAISYQPDWLHHIRVTRRLTSGRQSTRLLFRNPVAREGPPGAKARLRISSPEQGLDFEIAVTDPGRVVKRIIVETVPGATGSAEDPVVFSLDREAPDPD